MLLVKPPQDGPPDMVIREGKDALRTRRMSIAGSPAQEEGIQQSQSIRAALVGPGYVEQGGDLLAQACGTLLGGYP